MPLYQIDPARVTPTISALADAVLGRHLLAWAYPALHGPVIAPCEASILVLADALEEADCGAPDLVACLRHPDCRYSYVGRRPWAEIRAQLELIARIDDAEQPGRPQLEAARAAEEAANEAEAARKAAELAELERRRAAYEARQEAERLLRARRARLSRVVSPVVRDACGERGSPIPIEIVDGDEGPRVHGKRYDKYHFRRSYPSGKTFAKTVYTPSTRKIVVGRDWLAARVGAEVVAAYEAAQKERIA